MSAFRGVFVTAPHIRGPITSSGLLVILSRAGGLLIALCQSRSRSFSTTPTPHFSLPGLNLVTKHTLPIIPSSQNLLCFSSHKLAPAGLFSFALGVCFHTIEEHWAPGNLEFPSRSLQFSLPVGHACTGHSFHPPPPHPVTKVIISLKVGVR